VQLRIKGSGKLPGGLRLDVVDGQGAERAMDPNPAAVDPHGAQGAVVHELLKKRRGVGDLPGEGQ